MAWRHGTAAAWPLAVLWGSTVTDSLAGRSQPAGGLEPLSGACLMQLMRVEPHAILTAQPCAACEEWTTQL